MRYPHPTPFLSLKQAMQFTVTVPEEHAPVLLVSLGQESMLKHREENKLVVKKQSERLQAGAGVSYMSHLPRTILMSPLTFCLGALTCLFLSALQGDQKRQGGNWH